MKNFTNPLDNINIASPCSADWNEMYGDNRKRFCGDCQLNVYNLSDMSRTEAENLLMSSEGRLCVKFYRRQDETILTKDCPVGWRAIKRRVSKISAAVFSMIAGIFSGIFVVNQVKSDNAVMGTMKGVNTVDREVGNGQSENKRQYVMGANAMPVTAGTPVNLDNVRDQIKKNRK